MKRVVPAVITVALVIALPQAIHRFTRGAKPTPSDAVVAAAPVVNASQPDTYTAIPSTGVALVTPAGYTAHPERPGLKHDVYDASLLVFNLPEPFATVAARFEPEAMAARGLVFGSRENVQVDGRPAILITASQTIDGRAYEKLLTIIADDGRTVLLSATFPKDQLEALSLPLEDAMLTARLDAEDVAGGMAANDAFSDLPMRITPVDGFTLASRMENAAVLTRDGQLVTAAGDRATFAVGVEPVSGRVADRRAFAEQRLGFTQGVRDIVIYSGNYASLAGLPAYEIVATARFDGDDAPCFIHQTLAFNDTRVYVVQGLAHMSGGQRCLTQFQAMTGSFRLQTPPKPRPQFSTADMP